MIVLDEPTRPGVLNPSEMPLRRAVQHNIDRVPRRIVVSKLARRAQSKECLSHIGRKRGHSCTVPVGTADRRQRGQEDDARDVLHAA